MRDAAAADLATLAERELTVPDASAAGLGQPPGLDEALVGALPPADLATGSKATQSLADVVAALAPARPERDAKAGGPILSDDDRLEAVKAYTRGKAKLLERQFDAAIAEFDAATKLDPDASEAWREKAEALVGLGRRSSAMSAYQRSLDAGSEDPRVYLTLAREARRAGRDDDAAGLLARAWLLAPGRASPPLRTLVAAELGDVLIKQGRLTAGCEATVHALRTLGDSFSQNIYAAEIAELSRRRAEAWARVGDTMMRVGRAGDALDAYAQAADAPGAAPAALLPRRCAALVRLGRPAGAGMAVVESLRASAGGVSDQTAALIRFLATRTAAGPALRREITTLADRAGHDGSGRDGAATQGGASGPGPTARAGASLAVASAWPQGSEGERSALFAGLGFDPSNAMVLDALVESGGGAGGGPAGIAGSMARAVTVAGTHPDDAANAVVRRGRNLAAIVEALKSRRQDAGSRLVLSSILAQMGRLAEALDAVSDAPEETPGDGEGRRAAGQGASGAAWLGVMKAESRGRLLARVGRWGDAAAVADALSHDRSVRARAAQASVLAACMRPAAGLEAINGINGLNGSGGEQAGAGERAVMRDALLLGAELALSVRRAEAARDFARRAVEADAAHERGYEILIGLYSPGRPLADARALADTARALRDAATGGAGVAGGGGRVIRAVGAQELAVRGVLGSAEREALALCADGRDDPASIALLSLIWERAARADKAMAERGERWLKERATARPDSPQLTMALARVQAAVGKNEDAERTLAAWCERWPTPEVARQRERIVREQLKDAERADRLTRERLDAAGPLIGLDEAIDRAELSRRGNYQAGAITGLAAALPPGGVLSPDQASRVAQLLAGLDLSTNAKDVLAGAVALLDAVEASSGGLPAEFLATAVVCRAIATQGQADRIVEELESLVKVDAKRAGPLYDTVIQILAAKDDPSDAIAVFATVLNRLPAASEDAFTGLLRLAATRGDASDAVVIADRLTNAERLRELMRSFVREGETPPGEARALRTELLHTIANLLSTFGRDAVAAEVYRTILRETPTHAWSANNLGYMLVEQEGDLAEAASLIERAAGLLPNEASITDSLGWLRYKQGRIADDGATPGAVSLLGRAAELQHGEDNDTIRDHLGDALWRGGRHDDARAAWEKSLELAQGLEADAVKRDDEIKRRDPSVQLTPLPARQRRIAMIAQLKAKLAAVGRGEEPAVAELHPGVGQR